MSLADRFVLSGCDSILRRILQLTFPGQLSNSTIPPASNATAANFHPTKFNLRRLGPYLVRILCLHLGRAVDPGVSERPPCISL